mgnify:FL=1|jgi:hypothetical protein|tara:strand:+ start:649 stop:888 length:240 start_codon:yes stop_codon:yes gene_type:complete
MKTVTITMDARQAAAVRQALFTDTKVYTYDPKSVPERVVDIRNVILDIDEQLEKEEVECQDDCPPGTIYINGECAELGG